uniref:Uncharacterized protein n=1 Tax=Populus trichocarpa TaxID=3694 RepID=A0A3N7FKZ0_POPTR
MSLHPLPCFLPSQGSSSNLRTSSLDGTNLPKPKCAMKGKKFPKSCPDPQLYMLVLFIHSM